MNFYFFLFFIFLEKYEEFDFWINVISQVLQKALISNFVYEEYVVERSMHS